MVTDHSYDEWVVARELVDKFEDRIFDLRKYGFSFITALLTAQALLIPTNLAVATNQTYLPDYVKLAVIVVTLVLILALALFEKSYRLLQESAEQRTLILEMILNLELMETMTQQYHERAIWSYTIVIYVLFIVATNILAYAILPNNYIPWLVISSILGLASIQLLTNMNPHPQRRDWTIEKIECVKGEKVGITLTNVEPHDLSSWIKTNILRHDNVKRYRKDDLVWEIHTEDFKCIHQEFTEVNIDIHVNNSYTWLWDTNKCTEGIYRVIPEGIYQPLFRKIRVKENEE